MRKTAILIVLLLVFNGLCFAQSTGNETRIIGSWQSVMSSDILVLNNNGTTTGTFFLSGARYGIAGTKIAFYNGNDGSGVIVLDYSISTDGKTLILSTPNSMEGFWFTKR